MISSQSDEEDVIKWLFSEIVNFHIDGKPVYNKYQKRWASKTRMHKIIFSIVEEFDINVTRSLYMWGGFVHHDVLDSKYSYYRSYFHENPLTSERNRKKIQKYDIPVDDILEYIFKITPVISKLNSMNELQFYYEDNIPSEFINLYTSKQMIIVDLSALSEYNTLSNQSIFHLLNERIHDNFSLYHLSSLPLIDDDNIRDINFKFVDLIESSLEKVEYNLLKSLSIKKYISKFYDESHRFFIDFIWRPYACKVSQLTVKGLRKEIELRKMKNREISSIKIGYGNFINIKKLSEESNLTINWNEHQFLNTIKKKEKYKDNLNEIIQVYQNNEDE